MVVRRELLDLAAELQQDDAHLSRDAALQAAWLLMSQLDLDPTSRYRPCRVVMFSRGEDDDHNSSTTCAA